MTPLFWPPEIYPTLDRLLFALQSDSVEYPMETLSVAPCEDETAALRWGPRARDTRISELAGRSFGLPDAEINDDLPLRRVKRVKLTVPKVRAWGERRVIAAQSNLTPARIPQQAHSRPCLTRIANESTWSEDIRCCIQDHAYRRVLITYLQFVAYWGEGLQAERARTSDQSGSARCPHRACEAAHSALLPNLSDNWTQAFEKRIHSQGLRPELLRKLYILGVSAERLEEASALPPEDIEAHWLLNELSVEERTHLLALGTHLYHVANSTIELPYWVNRCDSALEAQLRPKAVTLLNRVSAGELHPFSAVEELVEMMRDFFTASIKQIESKIEGYESIYETEEALVELESALRSGEQIDPASFLTQYYRHLRSLRHLTQHVSKLNSLSPGVNARNYLQHRWQDLRLPEQYVIDLQRKLKDYSRPELQTLLGDLIERTRNMQAGEHPLEKARRESSDRRIRSCIRSYLSGIDSIDLLVSDPIALHAHYRQLSNQILSVTPNSLASWQAVFDYLHNCRWAMKQQSAATQVPPFELVSGVHTPNGRRVMTDAELVEQKLDIWAKCYDIKYI